MALRRIDPRRRPLLLARRAFSSANRPFPPPPPPPPSPASDHDAAAHPPSPSSPPPPNPGAPPNPNFSLFRDIRERLKSSPNPPPPRRIPTNPPRPGPSSGGAPIKDLTEVRRALENFSNKSGGGAPSLSAPGAAPSFVGLIRDSATLGPNNAGSKMPGFEAIRESLKLRPQPHQRQPRSPAPYLANLKHNIFNNELNSVGKGGDGEEDKDPGTLFSKSYTYDELGQKLGQLRPSGGAAAKDGFSLEELQGRVLKLVKMEKDERLGGSFGQLRESLMKMNQKQKVARAPSPLSSFMDAVGRPLTMLDSARLPPQEELLERYFHPDHMSSEEKMKLELQKVRDEFKMTENDCGSARVQIAQLTVKIKHLSSVLHKKDKHSRKGLQDMVQRRKKYLKYLRRTDWDSYTLVLSKLGLRDVPEYKAPDYKSQPTTKAKSKKSKNKRKRKMKA